MCITHSNINNYVLCNDYGKSNIQNRLVGVIGIQMLFTRNGTNVMDTDLRYETSRVQSIWYKEHLGYDASRVQSIWYKEHLWYDASRVPIIWYKEHLGYDASRVQIIWYKEHLGYDASRVRII